MGSVYLIYKPGRRFDTLSTFSMILRRNKTKTFENCCSCWSQISNKLKLKGYTRSSMAHLKHPKPWVGIKWVGTTVLWSRDMRCIPILGKITIFKYFSWIPYRVNMGDDWKGSLKKKITCSRVLYSSPNLFIFACVRGVCLHHRHNGHWFRPSAVQFCAGAKSFTSTGSTECCSGACVAITY